MVRAGLIILLLCSIIGCGPTPYFEEQVAFDNSTWKYEDVKVVEFDIVDTVGVYDLHLIIDHSTAYKHQNLYLRINTVFPELPPKQEQLTIDLAEQNGKWIGKCSSDDCKVKVFLIENFKFPSTGSYKLEFEQYTRKKNLPGLNSLVVELYRKN